MSRANIALGIVAVAAVLAAVLVTVANHKPAAKHNAVASYIKDVDAIEQRMRAPLTKTIQAYRTFASKGSVGSHGTDLARAEATLGTLHRRLEALPAPAPASRLRALLLRLLVGEVAIAHEVGQLAVFSPRYAAVLRQSRAAGAELKRGLASVKPPMSRRIRGTKKQVAKAQARFAAAATQAAAKQADAVDAYAAAVAATQSPLGVPSIVGLVSDVVTVTVARG